MNHADLAATTAEAEAEADQPSPWALVPLADYAVPTLPARSAAAQAWASLRQALLRVDDGKSAPARREDELRALSQVRLAHLVQPIDWVEVSRLLDGRVAQGRSGDGMDAAPAAGFLVGQPFCGHAAMVQAWAARQGAVLIEPPSSDDILATGASWQAPWPGGGRPWALPRLERFFLRHAHGLALVRRLLEDIASGRAGPGLVGCDSWAWAYLQRVWPLPQPEALTLQALDGAGLSQLFLQLAAPHPQRRLHFRNAHTGRDTLSDSPEAAGTSDQLVQLAAHCRGNVGMAREYWRQYLRAEPEAEAAQNRAAEAADADPSDEVVWVAAAPLQRVLPLEADEDQALLLHALLLHGGLPEALLADLLPLPQHRCIALALRLQRLGLLARDEDGRWNVATLGYAMVRRQLRGRDYLSDAF